MCKKRFEQRKERRSLRAENIKKRPKDSRGLSTKFVLFLTHLPFPDNPFASCVRLLPFLCMFAGSSTWRKWFTRGGGPTDYDAFMLQLIRSHTYPLHRPRNREMRINSRSRRRDSSLGLPLLHHLNNIVPGRELFRLGRVLDKIELDGCACAGGANKMGAGLGGKGSGFEGGVVG